MWNNETKRAYYTNTCDKLYEIDLYNCKCQGMCADSNHCAYIDNYCDNIVHMLFAILLSEVIMQVGIKLTEALSGVRSLAC